ncbi:MAG: penicillin-binding transpeptidase domain-containing protein, partial [Candidatus Hydrogenedentota bacterium]
MSKKGKGAVIVLDPDNGQVLALVSYPSFDPNEFTQNQ